MKHLTSATTWKRFVSMVKNRVIPWGNMKKLFFSSGNNQEFTSKLKQD